MAAPAAPTASRSSTVSWSAVSDAVAYWATIVGVYVAFGFLWYFSAKEKLIDQSGAMPAGLAKSYAGSFIESFPGLNASWLLLGLVEAAAFLLVVASLLRGEFLQGRGKPILLASLAVSLLTFALLTFGQDITGNHDSVAQLFSYMGVTAVVYLLLRFVPLFGEWRARA